MHGWEPSRKVPLLSVREAGVAACGAAVPRGQLVGEVERGGGEQAAGVRGEGGLCRGLVCYSRKYVHPCKHTY